MKHIRLGIWLFLFADLLALLSFWSPVRLFGLKALGRTGGCEVRTALQQSNEHAAGDKLRKYFEKNRRVVDRGPDGIELWEMPQGRIWSPPNDRILPFILAEQETKIYGTGERGVHKGDVVLDCGANVGMFTKTALASGAALVVAIEPAPVTVECLRRNLADEIAQGRVVIYAKGVWDRDAVLKLHLDPDNAGSNSFLFGQERPYVLLPLTTIDKIVGELKLTKVDFIKMDIEGSEKWALRGARQTISKYKPQMAISTEHLPDDTVEIPKVVRSINPGYHTEFSDCLDFGTSVQPQVVFFF